MDKDYINGNFKTNLEDILREGARRLLQKAIELEAAEYVNLLQEKKDERGRQMVKRNGYQPKREILTGVGPISIDKPRVRDKEFTSAILPRYMRRVPSLDALIPALYLKGISTGNMEEALVSILGKHAKGLSATNIVQLKKVWEEEYEHWNERDLSQKQYVYIWADGIYFNVRLTDDRPCLLVIIGALADGTKELIAIHDGIRESKLSWQNLLSHVKSQGLQIAPHLAIGDGNLGFWAALEEEFTATKKQRCWVHKTANILDKIPKNLQSEAKALIHKMYASLTKEEALKTMDRFCSLYKDRCPRACNCLIKDKEVLLNFYSFPMQHWQHIRSTNPIESLFATIRHRTGQTKGCGSRKATLSMVYKLATSAEKYWIRLKGPQWIEKLVNGIKFKDGNEIKKVA